MVNIPIPQRYADAVRAMLADAEICKTIIEAVGEAKAEEVLELEEGAAPAQKVGKEKVVWEW